MDRIGPCNALDLKEHPVLFEFVNSKNLIIIIIIPIVSDWSSSSYNPTLFNKKMGKCAEMDQIQGQGNFVIMMKLIKKMTAQPTQTPVPLDLSGFTRSQCVSGLQLSRQNA